MLYRLTLSLVMLAACAADERAAGVETSNPDPSSYAAGAPAPIVPPIVEAPAPIAPPTPEPQQPAEAGSAAPEPRPAEPQQPAEAAGSAAPAPVSTAGTTAVTAGAGGTPGAAGAGGSAAGAGGSAAGAGGAGGAPAMVGTAKCQTPSKTVSCATRDLYHAQVFWTEPVSGVGYNCDAPGPSCKRGGWCLVSDANGETEGTCL